VPIPWPVLPIPAAAVDEWRQLVDALRQHGPTPREDPATRELWHSTRGPEVAAEAVFGCSRCPVLDACGAYALAADERDGVWGGTTAAERRELAGRRR